MKSSQQADGRERDAAALPGSLSLAELGERIVADQHRHVRSLLEDLSERIRRLRMPPDAADAAQSYGKLADDFAQFDAELRVHLQNEAEELKIFVSAGESGDFRRALGESIAASRRAHAHAEESLVTLIAQVEAIASRRFRGQAGWRRLLTSMRRLELELQEQIHREQGDFFPRLLAVTRNP